MLLAKPDVSLADHLAEVTRLGMALARRLELSEPLYTKALLACALHDIGKATQEFQDHIQGRPGNYPHALASLPFVLLLEGQLNRALGLPQTRYEAAAAVLTHHSPLGSELYKGYDKPRYHPDLLSLLGEVWHLLQAVGVGNLPPLEPFWKQLQALLQSAPVALLDTPVRGVDEKRATLRGILQQLPPKDFACVKAVLHLADWLASAKKSDPTTLFLTEGAKAIAQHTERLRGRLRPFQVQARQAAADVLWLRAPTGTGKTEALLLWAGDTERLLYLLPTQATTNAMWQRLRRIYGEETVALAHGRAAYMLRQEADEDPLDARLFGSVFAKPVTVATLDQYLLAHLHGRHWEERRTLARRATVILDEIHAYEPYTLGLLVEALERERPQRLALASATLPEALLALFPPGHLVEADPAIWERRRHRLHLREGSLLEEGVSAALEAAQSGQAVLVVVNTIGDAQEFYRRLRQVWEDCELLHARFTFRDRQAKESRVSQPRPGLIFVATQVVEVSLDISYDVLITELAPVDALIQRMGRINRRGDKPPAPVIMYTQTTEGTQRVYGKEILSWSESLLKELPECPTDRDLAQATQELYAQVTQTPAWQEALEQGRQTLQAVQATLGCYTIGLSDEKLKERFATRRGPLSVEVLPMAFLEEAQTLKERQEGWRMPELLVPVPVWWLHEYKEAFSFSAELRVLLTTLSYTPELGLCPDFVEEAQFL